MHSLIHIYSLVHVIYYMHPKLQSSRRRRRHHHRHQEFDMHMITRACLLEFHPHFVYYYRITRGWVGGCVCAHAGACAHACKCACMLASLLAGVGVRVFACVHVDGERRQN